MREGGLSDEVTRDPRLVPGFDQARDLGMLPRVPETAPAPVTIDSRRVLLTAAGTAFGALVLVLVLVNGAGAPPWLLGIVSLAGIAAVAALLVRARSVMWQEIQAGYCRMDDMVALFSRDPEHRFPANRMRGAPWDLRGLWQLGADGTVVRPPDRSVLPPGLYPSPHRPGELELWTGVAWAYR